MPNFGGSLVSAGPPVDGVFQVERGTVIGTVTGDGNATVVITAAGMTGSPITVPVVVLNNDTATVVAGKIRAGLALNSVIAAFFTIGGTGAQVDLTRTDAKPDDATLNISIDNGTCSGLTTAATSTTTVAGVRGDWCGCDSGAWCLDTTNKVFYRNVGSAHRPVWSDI